MKHNFDERAVNDRALTITIAIISDMEFSDRQLRDMRVVMFLVLVLTLKSWDKWDPDNFCILRNFFREADLTLTDSKSDTPTVLEDKFHHALVKTYRALSEAYDDQKWGSIAERVLTEIRRRELETLPESFWSVVAGGRYWKTSLCLKGAFDAVQQRRATAINTRS